MNQTSNAINTKPGTILLISTIVLILINGFLTFIMGSASGNSGAGLIGYILGGIFLIPLVVVAISSIWKRQRNLRSRTKVFMITSIVVLLINIVSFLTLAVELANQN